MQEEQEQIRHKRRRGVTPYLYDWIAIQAQDWPTLSIRWGPVIAQDGHQVTQRLYASEQRGSDCEENRIVVYTVHVNRPYITAPENLLVNEGTKSTFFSRSVKEILHPRGEVNKIRESPVHANLLATHSDCPEVFVWNVDRQPNVAEGANTANAGVPDLTLTGHTEDARFALNWSTRDTWVCSGGEDFNVCVWDLGAHTTSLLTGPAPTPTGKKKQGPTLAALHVLKGHEATVEDVCFLPGSTNVLASVGDDKMLLLWDLRAGTKAVSTVKNAHKADVQALDWNRADPTFLATGGQDGVVKVWDVRHFTGAAGGGAQAAAPKAFASVEMAYDASDDADEPAITRIEWCPKQADMLACCTSGGQVVLYRMGGGEGGKGGKGTLAPVFRHVWHNAGVEDLHWNPAADANEVLLASCSQQERDEGGGALHLWRVNPLVHLPEEEAVTLLTNAFDAQGGAGAGGGQPQQPAANKKDKAAEKQLSL